MNYYKIKYSIPSAGGPPIEKYSCGETIEEAFEFFIKYCKNSSLDYLIEILRICDIKEGDHYKDSFIRQQRFILEQKEREKKEQSINKIFQKVIKNLNQNNE